jgi:hypothetical protein
VLFNGTTSRATTTGLGGVTAPGAITLAAILNRASTSGFRNVVNLQTAGNVTTMDLSANGTTLIMETNAGSVNGPTISTGWQYNAADKATGSTTPRFHKQMYGTDAAVAHSNGGAALGNGSAPAKICLGTFDTASDWFSGDMLVVGIWNRQLSDAEHEHLASNLNAWFLLNPDWLVFGHHSGALPTNIADHSANGGAPLTTLTNMAVSTSSAPVSWGAPILVATQDAAAPPTVFVKQLSALGVG